MFNFDQNELKEMLKHNIFSNWHNLDNIKKDQPDTSDTLQKIKNGIEFFIDIVNEKTLEDIIDKVDTIYNDITTPKETDNSNKTTGTAKGETTTETILNTKNKINDMKQEINHKDEIKTGIGYHKRKINKGVYGEITKIFEEVEELQDAKLQGNKIMIINELSDLIGAIEGYSESLGITLNDLIIMKDATKRAFITGERK